LATDADDDILTPRVRSDRERGLGFGPKNTVPTPNARTERRIQDIQMALKEARSGDVRQFLLELLAEQTEILAALEAGDDDMLTSEPKAALSELS
jgi:hypothetical protein